MRFYPQKLRAIRKKQKISMQELAKKMGIGWQTIWAWENSKRIPNELKIRSIAGALSCNMSDITDLPHEIETSDSDINQIADSWFSVIDNKSKSYLQQTNELVQKIKHQGEELAKAGIIINALLSSINAIIYIKDPAQRYIIANDKFLENLKISKTFNVKGKTDQDFFSKADTSANIHEDQQVLSTGKSIIDKEGFIPGSKKKKWGIISKIPIIDNNNKVAGIIACFVDISERVKAERLRKILEICIEKSNDGIALYSFDEDKFLYYNDALKNIIGIGKDRNSLPHDFNFTNIVHPDFIEQERQTIDINNKDIYTNNILKIIKYDTKEIRWIRKSTSRFTIGNSKYRLAITRDITDIKSKLEKLKLLEGSLIESRDVIWIINRETKHIEYVSSAVKSIYGYEPKEFLSNIGLLFWRDCCLLPEYRKILKINNNCIEFNNENTFKIKDSQGNIKHIDSKVINFNETDSEYFARIDKDVTRIYNNCEHTKTIIQALFIGCPNGKAKENCPLKKVRIKQAKEIAEYFLSLSEDTIDQIYTHHKSCFNNK